MKPATTYGYDTDFWTIRKIAQTVIKKRTSKGVLVDNDTSTKSLKKTAKTSLEKWQETGGS